jgi:hypothetical protein
MSSAWGNSWGSAWGNSWGSISSVTAPGGGGIYRANFNRTRHHVTGFVVLPGSSANGTGFYVETLEPDAPATAASVVPSLASPVSIAFGVARHQRRHRATGIIAVPLINLEITAQHHLDDTEQLLEMLIASHYF